MKKSDMIGKRFGKLVVTSFAYSKNGLFWNCHCDCGKDTVASSSHLNAGQSSCGCDTGGFKDLTGMKFNRLTVIKRVPNKGRAVMWECVCDCGSLVTVAAHALVGGHTKSCGCYHREQVRTMHTIHGERGRSSTTHLYGIWKGMHSRCESIYNTAYAHYGARGISVCPEWRDYRVFKEWALSHGYEDDLSIDRIDFNGNYEPSNCRWATILEQARNRSSNHYVTINGIKHTLSEWSTISGVAQSVIGCRIRKGWDAYSAVFKPVKHPNKSMR